MKIFVIIFAVLSSFWVGVFAIFLVVSRKILLYFGSFNPIHNGHINIALQALKKLNFTEFWFVLSPQNPLKPYQELLCSELRLQMLELALADFPEFKICSLELSLALPSYTYKTLRKLRALYPQDSFAILMGSDSFNNFPYWNKAREIQFLHDIYIFLRRNSPIDLPLPNNCYLLNTLPIDISATQIRENIRSGLAIDELVPKQVAEYIENYDLYRKL